MKAVIDTCVILDALQERSSFWEDALKVFYTAAVRRFQGFITAKSVTDIHYLMAKFFHDNRMAWQAVDGLWDVFDVLDTLAVDCQRALAAGRPDFEDAVMVETALRCEMDAIVTRNMKGYRDAPLLIITPSDFLKSGIWEE